MDDDPIELEQRGHLLVAQGHRMLARAAELRAREASDEWVAASSSPLGRRKTLALARAGVIASAKVGRKVLIRASSLREYVEQHCRTVAPTDEELFGITPRHEAPAARGRRVRNHGARRTRH